MTLLETLVTISRPSDSWKILFSALDSELKFELGTTYEPISAYLAVIFPGWGAFIK